MSATLPLRLNTLFSTFKTVSERPRTFALRHHRRCLRRKRKSIRIIRRVARLLDFPQWGHRLTLFAMPRPHLMHGLKKECMLGSSGGFDDVDTVWTR
jgi:hypothetical protein